MLKLFLILCMICLPFNLRADTDCDEKDICVFDCAKTANDSCTATLDKTTNTLTLKGYGDIKDYGWSCTPACHNMAEWGKYSSQIYKVVLENQSNDQTFKSIGHSAFEYMFAVKEVVLPEGLKSIGARAFNYDYSLTTINLPRSLENIGDIAFDYTQISEFILPENIAFTSMDYYGHLSSMGLKSLTISGDTIINQNILRTYDGLIPPYLESIYCENTNESCKELKKNNNFASKIKFYEKYGDSYYFNGKFYAHPNDISHKNNIKKRIYTIEEATKLSKESGNTFKIRYK